MKIIKDMRKEGEFIWLISSDSLRCSVRFFGNFNIDVARKVASSFSDLLVYKIADVNMAKIIAFVHGVLSVMVAELNKEYDVEDIQELGRNITRDYLVDKLLQQEEENEKGTS